MFARVDVLADDLASKERTGSLRAHNHLRTGAKDGIDEGVEDEGIQAVDGGQMAQVGGVGQGHGDVEGGHGESGHEVTTEVFPTILADPVGDGEVISQVPAEGERVAMDSDGASLM